MSEVCCGVVGVVVGYLSAKRGGELARGELVGEVLVVEDEGPDGVFEAGGEGAGADAVTGDPFDLVGVLESPSMKREVSSSMR